MQRTPNGTPCSPQYWCFNGGHAAVVVLQCIQQDGAAGEDSSKAWSLTWQVPSWYPGSSGGSTAVEDCTCQCWSFPWI
jgi:hypothetical protein